MSVSMVIRVIIGICGTLMLIFAVQILFFSRSWRFVRTLEGFAIGPDPNALARIEDQTPIEDATDVPLSLKRLTIALGVWCGIMGILLLFWASLPSNHRGVTIILIVILGALLSFMMRVVTAFLLLRTTETSPREPREDLGVAIVSEGFSEGLSNWTMQALIQHRWGRRLIAAGLITFAVLSAASVPAILKGQETLLTQFHDRYEMSSQALDVVVFVLLISLWLLAVGVAVVRRDLRAAVGLALITLLSVLGCAALYAFGGLRMLG